MLPPSRLFNARLSPESGRPVKVKKAAAAGTRGLFEDEMAIEEHRLDPRKQRVATIQMAPARLDHPNFRIGEEIDRFPEQMRRWNKIGIEDTDKFSARSREAACEGAGFKSGA